MHQSHLDAAKRHKLARAPRTSAEHHEMRDDESGDWHSQRSLQFAGRTYQLAPDSHNKSGQIEKV